MSAYCEVMIVRSSLSGLYHSSSQDIESSETAKLRGMRMQDTVLPFWATPPLALLTLTLPRPMAWTTAAQ
jgi:hypothetical protein